MSAAEAIQLVTYRRLSFEIGRAIEAARAANDHPARVVALRAEWMAATSAANASPLAALEQRCWTIASALYVMRERQCAKRWTHEVVTDDRDFRLPPGWTRADAIDRLTEETHRHALEFLDRLQLGDLPALTLVERFGSGDLAGDGMLFVDASLADYLESIRPGGEYGLKLAGRLRAKSQAAWTNIGGLEGFISSEELRDADLLRLWEFPVPALRMIALVAWGDVVRPLLANLRAPTLPLHLVRPMASAFFSTGRRIDPSGKRPLVVDAQGNEVARLQVPSPPVMPVRVLRGEWLGDTATAPVLRFLRWLPHRAAGEIARLRIPLTAKGLPEAAPIIDVPHLYGGLAVELGFGDDPRAVDGRVRAALQNGLDAIRNTDLRIGSKWYRGLLTVREDWGPSAGGRPRGSLRITPGDLFLPGGIFATGDDGKHVIDRSMGWRLVPAPTREPPLVGRNDVAAQLALQLLVLAEMADASLEFSTAGWIEIRRGRWRDLAEMAGLAASRISKVLEAWTTGAGEAPPFLERKGDHWTLAPAYEAERACLMEGGEVRAKAKTKGRRGGDLRWGHRARRS